MVDPENLHFSGKKKIDAGAKVDTLLTIFTVMLQHIPEIGLVSN
jgi:hypothetical protein